MFHETLEHWIDIQPFHPVITYANEAMSSSVFVCLSVC